MKKNTPKTDRKVYHRPELTSYGSLQQLTTGGTSDSPEGTGVGNESKISNKP